MYRTYSYLVQPPQSATHWFCQGSYFQYRADNGECACALDSCDSQTPDGNWAIYHIDLVAAWISWIRFRLLVGVLRVMRRDSKFVKGLWCGCRAISFFVIHRNI